MSEHIYVCIFVINRKYQSILKLWAFVGTDSRKQRFKNLGENRIELVNTCMLTRNSENEKSNFYEFKHRTFSLSTKRGIERLDNGCEGEELRGGSGGGDGKREGKEEGEEL